MAAVWGYLAVARLTDEADDHTACEVEMRHERVERPALELPKA